jgi:flagellar P-ring protein precursor FlgI
MFATIHFRRCTCAALALLAGWSAPSHAERVKDLAMVEGVRSNPLTGYGLVVGLDGTGDQTSQAPFTVQSLRSMLAQLGVTVPANVNPQLKNVAAVAVQAELPPFMKPGQKIDVTVSSIGNSGSLRGGALLMTPLKGADGQNYATAQGNVIVGGLGVSGKDGSRVSINVPSAGTIPNGAIIERAVANSFGGANKLVLNMHEPDFTTASRLASGINRALGDIARAVDPVTVEVEAPFDPAARVAFMAQIENLDVTPGEAAAKVIVNSRTGTVVINQHVQLLPAAVSHGTLSVTISEQSNVSQPGAFSNGTTAVTPQSNIQVTQTGGNMFKFQAGADLDQVIRAVNQVGASPGDLVSILEALKEAGALRAELVVI